ncbi:MAG: ATP-binding protein [Acidobacteriota bacterium]|nr:ATP-binding protein [Acidobacteriota bacterium]
MPDVLHIGPDDEAVLAELREQGIEVRASRDEEASPGRRFDVVAIAPYATAPLQIARRIRAESPDIHIIFLTAPENDAALRRELMIGRIGTRWSIAPSDRPEVVADVVRDAIARTEQQRKLRTTIGRVNLQLAHPAAATRRSVISDHFLALVLDQLSDAVVVLDPAGIVLAWNAAAAHAFGEVRRGARFGETLPPAARDAIQTACDAPEGRGESVLLSPRAEAQYGLRATALRAASGEVTGIALVARDITAARIQEKQRQLVSNAVQVLGATLDLRDALQRLADVLVEEFVEIVAVDVANGDEVTRYATAARRERDRALMASTRGGNLARNLRHPSLAAISRGETVVHNDIDDAVLQAAASSEEHLRVLRELQPRAFMVCPLRGGKETVGALIVARTTGGPFSRSEVSLVNEIARQASTAMHSIWSYHAAAEASRLKDEFLATLSHELRTPMTSILGWAQILQLADTPPEMTQEGLGSIERSARAQAQLIDDLLDLSRMQMGKVQLQLRSCSLSGVVRAAVETVRPAAQARGIELVFDAPEEVMVSGDPDRLQQVIWNLLSNAVKFSEAGCDVRVSVVNDGGAARVQVADRGRGIAPEFLPYVFDRFRQADAATTRRFGGLGLGLAIVKQLVELHGGTVEAASAGLGTGATFTVSLPRAPRTSAASTQPNADEEPARLPDLSEVCLLVVEDDPASSRMLCAMLERAGAAVRTVDSVAAALESLRERIPDLLVSDVAMPDEDGLALIHAVRNRLRIPAERLPAIALTAFNDVSLRVAVLGAGFQRFMTKPVDAQALVSIVAKLAYRGKQSNK